VIKNENVIQAKNVYIIKVISFFSVLFIYMKGIKKHIQKTYFKKLQQKIFKILSLYFEF